MAGTTQINSITPSTGVFSNAHAAVVRNDCPWAEDLTNSLDAANALVFFDVILASRFMSHLPAHPNLEQVRWKVEQGRLRLWTIIRQRDEQLQRTIYNAELHLLDDLKIPVDFSVVYLGGRATREVVPPDTAILRR